MEGVACVELPADDARVARGFIASTLARWHLGHLARHAVMVGHELVVNALHHGGPPASLRLRRGVDSVMIEVDDGGIGIPAIPEIDDATSTSGRGLRIVTALAEDWGVVPRPAGKMVWAEVSATAL
jgi:anti-sigma regulatory factor (Ser/Thr protein kinase)